MAKSKKGYINIISEVNKLLQEKRSFMGFFWNCYHDEKEQKSFDLSWNNEKDIDLTQTSYNLDFKVSTFQSRSENIYFNISLFDYETKKEIDAGYYYIKNYTGIIGTLETKALLDIIEAGTEITNKIYFDYH